MLDRRTLLAAAALAAPSVCAGRLYAAPAAGPRLLVVFLRGAYDAANIVVPTGSDFYYEARPNIAVPRAAALPLQNGWGLHPALKDSIMPLWQAGQIAFVPFCGTDDVSRSHFETQDTIELGQPVGGTRDYRSGFLARAAAMLSGSRPIAFTSQLPLIFRGGATPVPNIAVTGNARRGVDGTSATLIEAMYQGQTLAPAVAEGFKVNGEVYQALSAEMQAAGRGAISARGFEQAIRRIGLLMLGRFNLGFVDVGGWDTHVNQGGADGYLAARIGELGRGLAALPAAAGDVWKDMVVIVVSEFGRTFRENGDRGTDHGHGSTYWVLGGAVKGGRLAGRQVAVNRQSLFQDRDWPVLTDYRALIGGILARGYGLSREQTRTVFPGADPLDLSLL